MSYSGSPVPGTFVCNDCGALVANTQRHDRWHTEVQQIAAEVGL